MSGGTSAAVSQAMHEGERSFGLTVGLVGALIAGVFAWHHRTVAAAALGLLAAGLVVPAVIRPSLLRVPSAVWWRLAHLLGWVNGRVLLSLLFVGLMSPLGLIMRLGGWDPLRRQRTGSGESGWAPYPERHRGLKHFERMF